MDVILFFFLALLRISGISGQQFLQNDRWYRRQGGQRDSLVAKGAEKRCEFEGRTYESGDRIPRNHVCHICTCNRGNVDCMWIQCPPAPEGCTEMSFPGVCNPLLYRCPIPPHKDPPALIEATTARSRRSDIPPDPIDYDADCKILDVPYRTGETIGVASHFCLDCKCAKGEMYCRPTCCYRPAKPNEDSFLLMAAFRDVSRRPQERHPLHHLREDFERANS